MIYPQRFCLDIESLGARKDSIKGKIAVAKATKRVNEMTAGASKANSSMEEFDRWEKKADKMLDKANAEEELNKNLNVGDNLVDKYRDNHDADVEADLEKMKQEMGLK